jgi:AcrR family transcriptional regulator
VAVALRLFHERGVSATAVDDVLAEADAGKGQFYRYFDSKQQLVAAVVAHRIEHYLAPQQERLERLEAIEDLEHYFGDLVDAHRDSGLRGGCPVGSLALELARRNDAPREQVADAMRAWEASLATGLSRLAERGELRRDVPPERLAAGAMASLQGAYLLATGQRDAAVMEQALAQAVDDLRP